MKDIPHHLETDFNRPVLKRLAGTSAHGDLSELFEKIIRESTEADIFIPNDRPYSYYFAYANSTIFGFCTSMKFITLFLPEQLHAEMTAAGGKPSNDLSQKGWFDLGGWRDKKLDHSLWAKRAYLNALG